MSKQLIKWRGGGGLFIGLVSYSLTFYLAMSKQLIKCGGGGLFIG